MSGMDFRSYDYVNIALSSVGSNPNQHVVLFSHLTGASSQLPIVNTMWIIGWVLRGCNNYLTHLKMKTLMHLMQLTLTVRLF